jgi:AcrR family transcriptional regulator
MERKEIQEQRMRGYFIDATREMLKGEGLKSVNVRAIAERAGYSYATLYNYFKDIKELIFICVKDFQEEALAFIREREVQTGDSREQILSKSMAMLEYFVQYPGIFELFYLEKMNSITGKHPTASLIYEFPVQLTQKDWDALVEQKYYSKEEAGLRQNNLKFLLPGLLLMYLNRMHPESYKEFTDEAGRQIRALLGL